MDAIILAAGRSRRLLPTTTHIPKCLLTVGSLTLIDRLVHSSIANGVKRIAVVVGFKAEMLKEHLKTRHSKVPFVFIENKDYANTNVAYSLWLARKYLSGSALYLNADVLCDPEIIKSVIRNKKPSITALRRNTWDAEQVNIIVDKQMRVTEIGKKITARRSIGEFVGITKLGGAFNKHLLVAMDSLNKKGDRNKFAADAIHLAIQRGGVLHALDVSRYKACEVDTIEDYRYAQTLKV